MLSTAECDLIRSSVFVEGVQALANHISVDNSELEDVKRENLYYLKSGSPATEKKIKELVKPLTRSQTYQISTGCLGIFLILSKLGLLICMGLSEDK